MSKTPEERFWSKVQKAGADECWQWSASVKRDGFGEFKYSGKMMIAHRVAFLLCIGPIPAGLFVRHRCRNQLCCNPAHLYTATPKECASEMVASGRKARRNGATPAKLDDQKAEAIREAVAKGGSYREVAKAFGVDRRTISRVHKGISWPAVAA